MDRLYTPDCALCKLYWHSQCALLFEVIDSDKLLNFHLTIMETK